MNYSILQLIKYLYNKENSDSFNFILWTILNKGEEPARLSKIIIDEAEFRYRNKLSFIINSDEIKKDLLSVEINKDIVDFRYHSKIKYLKVSSFRGFGNPVGDQQLVYIPFKDRNIFFGPNGSGKTSLCEALEYIFTSNIKEAKRRDIDLDKYIKYNNGHIKPQIEIEFDNDQLNINDINEFERFEFEKCFFDKNRINEFALLSGSKDTNVKPNDIISRILGFTDLDDFKSRFVQEQQFKTTVLSKKESKLQTEIIKLNDENSSNKKLYDYFKNKKSLLNIACIRNEIIFYEWKIQELQKILSKLISYNVKKYTLPEINTWIKNNLYKIYRYKYTSNYISTEALNINYKKLYESVLNIHEFNSSVCPACKTPIKDVVENPFNFAKTEIIKLQYLVNYQEINSEINEAINGHVWNELKEFFNDYKRTISFYPSLQTEELERLNSILIKCNNIDEKIDFLKELYYSSIRYRSNHEKYIGDLNSIIQRQLKSDKLKSCLKDKISRIQKLLESKKIEEAEFMNYTSEIKRLYPQISDYSIKLEELELRKDYEMSYNQFLDNLITAYNLFYSQMNDFIFNNQKLVIQKIENKILHYYHQINKSDEKIEFVKSFIFNEIDSRYEIDILDYDNNRFEASKKLSEGHLRSLGLSILIANAEFSNLPFLIFDDVINAIDSDHRANILDMIIHDSFFQNIQIIVTTHDRFFWERYCNECNGNSLQSIILRFTDQGIISSLYNCSLDSVINESLKNYDIRQALLNARILFETLAKQFCLRNNVKIKGQFKNKHYNYFCFTLKTMYDELLKIFPNNQSLNILQKDIINSKGINQEHHSFDDYNYNFSHSYTSNEVLNIINAVKELERLFNFQSNSFKIINNEVLNYNKIREKLKGFTINTPREIFMKYMKQSYDSFKIIKNHYEDLQKVIIDDDIKNKILKLILPIFISELISCLTYQKDNLLSTIKNCPPNKPPKKINPLTIRGFTTYFEVGSGFEPL